MLINYETLAGCVENSLHEKWLVPAYCSSFHVTSCHVQPLRYHMAPVRMPSMYSIIVAFSPFREPLWTTFYKIEIWQDEPPRTCTHTLLPIALSHVYCHELDMRSAARIREWTCCYNAQDPVFLIVHRDPFLDFHESKMHLQPILFLLFGNSSWVNWRQASGHTTSFQWNVTGK